MERIIEKVDFQLPPKPQVKRVAAYARVSSGKDEITSMSAYSFLTPMEMYFLTVI